jgi:hypothetical protein
VSYPTGPLLTVVQALETGGAECALGGSGLLCSLGLATEVRDWDLTTEAPLETVQQLLVFAHLQLAPSANPLYASRYMLTLVLESQEIDVIGRFTIRTESGPCHLPTIVSGRWLGAPVGAPEVWAAAYRLMGRHAKADLLAQYLQREGARSGVVARLLEEPLPDEVRREVAAWPLA